MFHGLWSLSSRHEGPDVTFVVYPIVCVQVQELNEADSRKKTLEATLERYRRKLAQYQTGEVTSQPSQAPRAHTVGPHKPTQHSQEPSVTLPRPPHPPEAKAAPPLATPPHVRSTPLRVFVLCCVCECIVATVVCRSSCVRCGVCVSPCVPRWRLPHLRAPPPTLVPAVCVPCPPLTSGRAVWCVCWTRCLGVGAATWPPCFATV